MCSVDLSLSTILRPEFESRAQHLCLFRLIGTAEIDTI